MGRQHKGPPSGSGTKGDPYLIGTGAELAWFADQVKNGKVTLCAKLTADIDLNGHPGRPLAVLAARIIKAPLTGATVLSMACMYPVRVMRVCSV